MRRAGENEVGGGSSGGAMWAEALYLVHTLLELVLGAVKLRGKYSGLDMPEGAAKFAQHHGVALLALALLGALVLQRGLVRSETGVLVSTALAAFHAGAVAVMALHLPAGAKVALLHTPFAVGFAWHALGGRPSARRSRRS